MESTSGVVLVLARYLGSVSHNDRVLYAKRTSLSACFPPIIEDSRVFTVIARSTRHAQNKIAGRIIPIKVVAGKSRRYSMASAHIAVVLSQKSRARAVTTAKSGPALQAGAVVTVLETRVLLGQV